MRFTLLSLPSEIRLEIYDLVFGRGKVIIDSKGDHQNSCLLPRNGNVQNPGHRSAQLLRVCKVILSEARPILYSNSTFHVITHEFAGRLPSQVTDGFPASRHVKNLIWQLDCDMLMLHYPEDLKLDESMIARWNSLEIRCKADSWRNSFMGEWCDREAFVKGRTQMISYAGIFQAAMSDQTDHVTVGMWEDRSQLGRGRVILKLNRSPSPTRPLLLPPDHLPVLTAT